MAHCGGNPVAAVEFLVGAVASSPAAPEPYASLAGLWRERRPELEAGLAGNGSVSAVTAQAYFFFLDGNMDDAAMALGSVTGARPDVAWGAAPWFSDERFLDEVSPEALAEACLRTLDYGHDLDTDAMRERFAPWFHAVEAVGGRSPVPESPAAMSRLPRACGRYDLAFALCDRADAIEPVMWTAVARGSTWRVMGDLDRAAAAFDSAIALDPPTGPSSWTSRTSAPSRATSPRRWSWPDAVWNTGPTRSPCAPPTPPTAPACPARPTT